MEREAVFSAQFGEISAVAPFDLQSSLGTLIHWPFYGINSSLHRETLQQAYEAATTAQLVREDKNSWNRVILRVAQIDVLD